MELWFTIENYGTKKNYYTENYVSSIYEGKTWQITKNSEPVIYNGKSYEIYINN